MRDSERVGKIQRDSKRYRKIRKNYERFKKIPKDFKCFQKVPIGSERTWNQSKMNKELKVCTAVYT